MHISKEGDPYLRTLLVQGAQHILGPFGVDCDLRRWGLKLAERGRKERKEAGHHCHSEKARGVAASLVDQWRSIRTAAQQRPSGDAGGSLKQKHSKEGKARAQSRVPVTAFNRLAQTSSLRRSTGRLIRWQRRLKRERPTCTERKNRSQSADGRMATVATRQEKKPCPTKTQKNPLDSDRPSHGRRLHVLTSGQ